MSVISWFNVFCSFNLNNIFVPMWVIFSQFKMLWMFVHDLSSIPVAIILLNSSWKSLSFIAEFRYLLHSWSISSLCIVVIRLIASMLVSNSCLWRSAAFWLCSFRALYHDHVWNAVFAILFISFFIMLFLLLPLPRNKSSLLHTCHRPRDL